MVGLCRNCVGTGGERGVGEMCRRYVACGVVVDLEDLLAAAAAVAVPYNYVSKEVLHAFFFFI